MTNLKEVMNSLSETIYGQTPVSQGGAMLKKNPAVITVGPNGKTEQELIKLNSTRPTRDTFLQWLQKWKQQLGVDLIALFNGIKMALQNRLKLNPLSTIINQIQPNELMAESKNNEEESEDKEIIV